MSKLTHYSVLGVAPGVSDAELRAAFHALARKYHPDTNGALHITKFNEITAAYGAIKTPVARAKYDAELKALGGQCKACEGKGVVQRSKGFTTSVIRPCKQCNGTGYPS